MKKLSRSGFIAACCLAAAAQAQPASPSGEPVRAPDASERQVIGEYVRAHLSPLRECYERRLRTFPGLQGRLMARFDITADGKVDGVVADGGQDASFATCVLGEIRRWEFARSAPGRIRVAYPLVFKQG